jgi:hypothetical protein
LRLFSARRRMRLRSSGAAGLVGCLYRTDACG